MARANRTRRCPATGRSGVVLCVLVVLAPRPAPAEVPTSGRGVASDARDAYRAGLERFRAHDYASAVEEFERAYSIYPKPELLYDIAQALRLDHRCSGAHEYYERFLATQPVEPLLSRAKARSSDTQRCAENAESKGSNALAGSPGATTIEAGSSKPAPPAETPARAAPVARVELPARTATTSRAVPFSVVLGTGALAAASGVVGFVAYARYASANEQAQALCPNTPPDACSELELREHARLTSTARAARSWFYVGVGTAAVATAVTVTLLLWPTTSAPHAARDVRIEAGLRGGAVSGRVSLTW